MIMICLGLVYCYWLKNTVYVNNTVSRFLIPSFIVKIFGWVVSILLLIYYFESRSDSVTTYFSSLDHLRYVFREDTLVLLKYILIGLDPQEYNHYNIETFLRYNSGTSQVVKIGLFLSLLVGKSYLIISLIFTLLGYVGTWKLFVFFKKLYPSLYLHFAISFLFLPSMVIWGVGFMKEPIVLFGLPFLISGFYSITFLRSRFLVSLISIVLGSWLILSVKTYIFLALTPAMLIWLVSSKLRSIKNLQLRIFAIPVFLTILMISIVGVSMVAMSKSKELAVDNLSKNIEYRMNWWSENSDHGSSYRLPQIKLTPSGIVSSLPSLFLTGSLRPYLWEARSLIVLFSALETFVILIFALLIFLKNGLVLSFKKLTTVPILSFLIIYSLIFFPVIAMTSGNFGTLVRYKLPCLPFFMAMLSILHYEKSKKPLPSD